MSFRKQLALAGVIGMGSAAIALAVYFFGRHYYELGQSDFISGHPLSIAFNLFFGLAGVSLIFGVFARSVHAWGFRNTYFQVPPEEDRILSATVNAQLTGAFWRWWVHTDRFGKPINLEKKSAS